MPQNKTDNVGVLEVLRCLLQNSMVWDEEKLVQKKYEDLQFISTISQPRDDFKISNHYQNILEGTTLLHFDDISMEHINLSIYSTLIHSLPNMIDEQKFSKLAMLSYQTRVKDESGFLMKLRPDNYPVYLKQFASKMIEAVSTSFQQMGQFIQRTDERYTHILNFSKLMDLWSTLTSLRGIKDEKQFVGYLVYELEQQFGDILELRQQDFNLFKDILIDNLSCDDPLSIKLKEQQQLIGKKSE